MFVSDFCLIPSIIACYFIGKAINSSNTYRYFSIIFTAKVAICLVAYFIQAQQQAFILLFSIVIKVASSLNYYMKYCLIN
jgi:Na+/melibiose symporter-like transporter